MNVYKTIDSTGYPTLNLKLKSGMKTTRNVPRPGSSLNQITKMNVYQKKNLSPNHDLLKLMIENSPTKYDLGKLKKKMEAINPIYTERTNKSRSKRRNIDELYYKYNILYGSKSNTLIRTYSPKMRPVSSSIKSFKQTLIIKKRNECNVFTDEEVDTILQSKTKDLRVEYREEMRDKFRDYCRNKCSNRRVDFTDCYISLYFISSLSSMLYSSDRIAYLDLTQNNIGDEGVQILCDAIQSSTSLVMLNVTSNNLSHKGGDSIFQMLIKQESIISMNLSSIEGVNRNRICSVGLKHIVEVLNSNSFIEDLNIGGNSIKDEGLKLLSEGMRANSHLHHINISNNDITSLGIQTHFEQIKGSKIIELNISTNPIKNEGLIKITDCLGNFSLIKKLNVSNCEIDFKGFYYLILNLQNVKRLESLDISENDLSTNNFASIRINFQQCGLKYLNMSKCNLGNLAGFALGSCLCINDSIRKIELRSNKITDKGFKSYAMLPKLNMSIESFDISKNYISDSTAIEFIQNLATNKSIRSLNMYDNQLKNESGTTMIDVLMKNKTITSVNFVFNRVQLKLIEEINRRVYDNVKRCKRRLVPNLIQEIKTLRFNLNEFNFLKEKISEEENTTEVLEAKLEEETLTFAQMKIDDKNQCELAIKQNKEIEKSIKPLDEQLKRLINEIKMNQSDVIKKKELLKKEIEEVNEIILKQKKINEEEKKERNDVILSYEVEYNQLNQKYKLLKEKANLSEISLKSIKIDLNKKNEQVAELETQLSMQVLKQIPNSSSRRQSKSGLSPKAPGSPNRRKSLLMMQKRDSVKGINKRNSTLKVYSLSPTNLNEDSSTGTKTKIKGKNRNKKNSNKKVKAKNGSKGKKMKNEGQVECKGDENGTDYIIKLMQSGEIEKNVKISNLSTISKNDNKPIIPVLNVKTIIHPTNESTKQTTETTTNVLTTFNSSSAK